MFHKNHQLQMIGQESREVEREKIAILRILADTQGAVGSKVIARRLKVEYSISLSERAVRYHLGLMDERGLTHKVSRRDGRDITAVGFGELENAMVVDKVGFVIEKIERLAFRSSFDPVRLSGQIPVNISLFPRDKFAAALKAMSGAFKAGLCVSDLVMVAEEGQKLGSRRVPPDSIGMATVCSIVINGTLLKAGVPMDSRFGGILQLEDSMPRRFTEIIDYTSSSLDPSEIFTSSRMTSVGEAARTGTGKLLANFREIPSICLPLVRETVSKLEKSGINGVMAIGETSKPVCEIPVSINRVGVVLYGGLNPVAAAAETGIETDNKAMNGLVDSKSLKSFWEVYKP